MYSKYNYMKKILFVLTICGILYACSEQSGSKSSTNQQEPESQTTNTSSAAANDPDRGIGKFTNVEVKSVLDPAMAATGEKVYEVKCASCHKLTEEKLVGPGWKGVISRHKVEWIMNFTTNPDEMLNKDPKAMAQLEICLVRMPNQGLTDDDARSVYEFMRKNDGVK